MERSDEFRGDGNVQAAVDRVYRQMAVPPRVAELDERVVEVRLALHRDELRAESLHVGQRGIGQGLLLDLGERLPPFGLLDDFVEELLQLAGGHLQRDLGHLPH